MRDKDFCLDWCGRKNHNKCGRVIAESAVCCSNSVHDHGLGCFRFVIADKCQNRCDSCLEKNHQSRRIYHYNVYRQGKELGITIVPMPIIIDGKTYFEGVDLTVEEFYRLQGEGAEITSSLPSQEYEGRVHVV